MSGSRESWSVAIILLLGALIATNVSAAALNMTTKGNTCVPPTSNCFSGTITVSAYSGYRGRMAYTTAAVIESMTEEELIARFRAEFIVATDVEPYDGSVSVSPATTVRGQSIGF